MKMRPFDALIVIPCYNEAERLQPEVFESWIAAQPNVGFVFVDDGSTDATRKVLTELTRSDHGHFQLREHERNLGKAEAVRLGMRAALEARPSYAGYWDADLSTPLDEIPHFLELLDADPRRVAALGARVKLLGRSIGRSRLRHVVGRLFATLAARILGLPVYDTQCGAKLFRVTAELRAVFAEPFTTSWAFDVEILARLIDLRGGDPRSLELELYEHPVREWHDVPGSKVRVWDFPRALFELGRIRSLYLQRPSAPRIRRANSPSRPDCRWRGKSSV